ncbi:hypothetical protein Taro_042556 [Colocasia esculenta]|uniref:Uncharacterized protein n=1 Tax=Colocasia esculenta TaxID=4460 RepID=A0A843WT60_COLES|nr:hypothetical protein [Colocasia esculenta]
MPSTFRDSGLSFLKHSSHYPTAVFPSAGRATQHKSEGVQEVDKTSSVPSTGTSPKHTHVPGSHKTWGSQLKRYPQ